MPRSETVITYTKQELESLIRANISKYMPEVSDMDLTLYGTIKNVNGGNLSADLDDIHARITIVDIDLANRRG